MIASRNRPFAQPPEQLVVIDIPKRLQARLLRVSSGSWKLMVEEFKLERRRVIKLLRKQGLSDTTICELLEISHQYLWKAYGRRDGTKGPRT